MLLQTPHTGEYLNPNESPCNLIDIESCDAIRPKCHRFPIWFFACANNKPTIKYSLVLIQQQKQRYKHITRSLVSCLHFLVILSVYWAALSNVSWFLITSMISSSSLTFSRYSLSICLRRLSISCPRCNFSCLIYKMKTLIIRHKLQIRQILCLTTSLATSFQKRSRRWLSCLYTMHVLFCSCLQTWVKSVQWMKLPLGQHIFFCPFLWKWTCDMSPWL